MRSLTPYTKLGDNRSVGIIIEKYMKMANILHQANDGKSFHAFRRSMGTWMLESDIPLSIISQVLGHKSMNSAKLYLSKVRETSPNVHLDLMTSQWKVGYTHEYTI